MLTMIAPTCSLMRSDVHLADLPLHPEAGAGVARRARVAGRQTDHAQAQTLACDDLQGVLGLIAAMMSPCRHVFDLDFECGDRRSAARGALDLAGAGSTAERPRRLRRVQSGQRAKCCGVCRCGSIQTDGFHSGPPH